MKYRGIPLWQLFFGGIAIIACSYIVTNKISNFPDFENYEFMIRSDEYINRYSENEPLSAALMWAISSIDQGAYLYYLITWIFSVCIVLLISICCYPRLWFTTAIFLIFNPLNIIAFETPRHFMGISVFLIALHLSGVWRWLIQFSILLFQNLLGLFVICFLFLKWVSSIKLVRGGRNILLICTALFGFGVFHYIAFEYFDYHIGLDVVRGRGLLAYTALFFVMFGLLTQKDRREWLFMFAIMSLSFAIYLYSQVGYRFFEVSVCYAFFHLAFSVHSKFFIFILRFFTFMSAGLSMMIVVTGRFGYGL